MGFRRTQQCGKDLKKDVITYDDFIEGFRRTQQCGKTKLLTRVLLIQESYFKFPQNLVVWKVSEALLPTNSGTIRFRRTQQCGKLMTLPIQSMTQKLFPQNLVVWKADLYGFSGFSTSSFRRTQQCGKTFTKTSGFLRFPLFPQNLVVWKDVNSIAQILSYVEFSFRRTQQCGKGVETSQRTVTTT